MSNKTLLKFVIASGLLAMVLVFLGVNYVPRSSALSSTKENAVNAAIYAGSNWIERHPPTVSRLEELARIKDDVIPADARLDKLTRLEELARIKDEGFSVDTRAARLARLEELARIKDR